MCVVSDAERWAPKAYVDPLFQDVYEKLGQLALNTESELRRFAQEVRSLFDSMNTTTTAAAGKVHFRCLTCDSVVQTLKGPHSRRMAAATGAHPHNMSQIAARQLTELRLGGGSGSGGGGGEHKLLIEGGESGYLYGADGNVYKARDDDTVLIQSGGAAPSLLPPAGLLQSTPSKQPVGQSSPRKVITRPASASASHDPALLLTGPNSARKPTVSGSGGGVSVRAPTPSHAQDDAFADVHHTSSAGSGGGGGAVVPVTADTANTTVSGDSGGGGGDTSLSTTAPAAPVTAVAVTSRASKLQQKALSSTAGGGGRPQTPATNTDGSGAGGAGGSLAPPRPASSLGISSPAAPSGIAWIETPSYNNRQPNT